MKKKHFCFSTRFPFAKRRKSSDWIINLHQIDFLSLFYHLFPLLLFLLEILINNLFRSFSLRFFSHHFPFFYSFVMLQYGILIVQCTFSAVLLNRNIYSFVRKACEGKKNWNPKSILKGESIMGCFTLTIFRMVKWHAIDRKSILFNSILGVIQS